MSDADVFYWLETMTQYRPSFGYQMVRHFHSIFEKQCVEHCRLVMIKKLKPTPFQKWKFKQISAFEFWLRKHIDRHRL